MSTSVQTRFSVSLKIGAGFTVALGALAMVSVLSFRANQDLLENAQWVAHTQQVWGRIAHFTAMLRTAQAEVRAYALTGDRSFLTEHAELTRSLHADLAELMELTHDNPAQQARFTEVNALLGKKLGMWENTIRARETQGIEGAAQAVSSTDDRAAMRAMVVLLEAGEKMERSLLAERGNAAQHTAAQSRTMLVWTAALAALLVAVIGWFIGRDISAQVVARERVLAGIREATQLLSSSTAELLAAATQQGSGAQEQVAAIAQTATTAEEITQTATQAAERVRNVAEASQRSVQVTSEGRKAVAESVERIAALKGRVSAMADNILQLAENAQAIQELTTMVSDLAEQSNILALNAAIEASRAGEHGRGFAVVASEVRALAEQSKKATKQVTGLLGEMQRQTARAVVITEEGTKSADLAVRSVNDAGEMFNEIAERTAESAQAAVQVAASASQQSLGVTQIQQAMRDIQQITAQGVASTKQIERASHDLNLLSGRLRDLIGASA